MEQLRQEERDAEGSIDLFKRNLAKLAEERQWVVTQARKKSITESDMDRQLALLDAEEAECRRELAEKNLLVGGRAERLLEFAN